MKATSPADNLNKLLVSTKFAPPRVGSRYIVRTQLLDALERDRHCKLTLVTGSAGFGKTILLAQWRQELMKAGLHVAWLSLSRDETLLPNFRAHLFAALGRLGFPLEEELLLSGEDSASIESVVAVLIKSLAAINDDRYLILDDYHHVEDPWAHKLVQKLLDHSPGNLHLVIASRALPPLSVAKLRVMGQVAEIECADLPFSLVETRSFLEQSVSAGKFSANEINQIHSLTNGWPASLQLLAITLRNRPESRATLRNLARQSANLHNYLSEDVLARLPPELAEFMEAISICRRFNSALAEAITGNTEAASLLRLIEEENLLIMRAEWEGGSPWYRFHPLFAEFLAARLERHGAAAVNALHRRAGIWFAQNGLVVEAIRHATLGHDVASAVAIIERSAPTNWSLRHLGPLLHLINNLSPQSIASHPRLLYLGSLTLAITGRHARAADWIAQMRVSDPANTPATAFRVALASALSALQGDDTARAIELLEPLQASDAKSAFERHVFVATLAPSLAAAGRYAEAYRLLDAHPTTPDDDHDDTALLMAGGRTILLLLEGKAVEAERTSFYTRNLTAHGPRSICTSMSAALLADTLYEQDRIDEARELLANGLHGLGASSPEIMIRAVLCQARLDLLQDSAETALALLDRQANSFRSLGLDRAVAYMYAEQSRILAAKGNRHRAIETIARLDEIAAPYSRADGFLAEIPIVATMAHVRIELLCGEHERALQALTSAREIATRLGRAQMVVSIDILAAIALQVAGRSEEASQRLEGAVRLGSQLGLVRTFVGEGEQMYTQLARLMQEGRLDGAARAYVGELLGHFDQGTRSLASNTVDAKGKTPLTPRELEILHLLATGMSNKRIALTLSITLQTVKWNLKNVFGKLRVSSRYDAIIWGRRQGLIK
jgi:LuxR family transcriptional regulator, maltose regulon positive regulatory protein